MQRHLCPEYNTWTQSTVTENRVFAVTQNCDRVTCGCCFAAQCVHIPNRGFRRGSYRCECFPRRSPSGVGSSTRTSNVTGSAATDQSGGGGGGLSGDELERAYVENLLSGVVGPPVGCPSCERGCSGAPCADERACMAEYDPLLRGIPLGVQSLCITVTVILTIVIVRLRKTKVSVAFIVVIFMCS